MANYYTVDELGQYLPAGNYQPLPASGKRPSAGPAEKGKPRKKKDADALQGKPKAPLDTASITRMQGNGVPGMLQALRRLNSAPAFREHMEMVTERADVFGNTVRMKLAAIGMDPAFRRVFDEELDVHWRGTTYVTFTAGRGTSRQNPLPEIVIGGGLHAAIYASARVAAGYPAPVILEQNTTPGGVFAVSRKPSFRVNSNNVPGATGIPGARGALNYLPCAPVQPADLNGDEFQANTDLAFCIRAALALNAQVITGCRVTKVDPYSNPSVITTPLGTLYAKRVIDVRGLGDEKATDSLAPGFRTFMASMDTPWPLAGKQRWAVNGNGNSAMNVIESLIGLGPTTFPATADYIAPMIDWYAPNLESTRAGWRDNQRGRYSRIGSALARGDRFPQRVRVRNEIGFVAKAGDMMLVNSRAYDAVVDCTGWNRPALGAGNADFANFTVGGMAVARYAGKMYRAGPAAGLSFADAEIADGVNQVRAGSNEDAIFRYAFRTAALASGLPA